MSVAKMQAQPGQGGVAASVLSLVAPGLLLEVVHDFNVVGALDLTVGRGSLHNLA